MVCAPNGGLATESIGASPVQGYIRFSGPLGPQEAANHHHGFPLPLACFVEAVDFVVDGLDGDPPYCGIRFGDKILQRHRILSSLE